MCLLWLSLALPGWNHSMARIRELSSSNQPILLQRRTAAPTEWGKFDYDIAVEGAKNLLKRQGVEDTIFIPAPIRDATEVRPAG